MKEIFKRLIVNSQERIYTNLITREYTIPNDTNKIVSLIGVRRSGKTYMSPIYKRLIHFLQHPSIGTP